MNCFLPRKPKSLLDLETDPDIQVSGNFKEYYESLKLQLQYLHNILQDFQQKRLALMNKDKDYFQYKNADLVYIISPLISQL